LYTKNSTVNSTETKTEKKMGGSCIVSRLTTVCPREGKKTPGRLREMLLDWLKKRIQNGLLAAK